MLELRKIYKYYILAVTKCASFNNFNFKVDDGGVCCGYRQQPSGKNSMLNIICGAFRLIELTNGTNITKYARI